MAVALEQFIKQLEDSGVISAGKLENFVPPKGSPKSAEDLAKELVKQKQLTKFQAQEIYAGRAKSLILGSYTLVDKIGAGGMGQVFKAEHRRMKRIVAIKVLPKNAMKDAAAVARFQREVEAAAKLSHPNIVAAHDADEANGVHFLAMEYVEGSDLSALVKANGPLAVEKAINYILQVARGLEFAHAEGVVHRDIKPANLLLDKKGTVKILDMGLARIDTGGGDAATQAELTGTGAVLGTVDFMAPEQAMSTKHADARADIYSLGCSLYYLLSGKPTYEGESLMAKLLAHRESPIPLLKEVHADVPDGLQAVFSKMVAKKIEDRYQTMSEVVADLQPFAVAGTTNVGSGQVVTDAPVDSGSLSFLQETTVRSDHPRRTKPVRAASANASPSATGGWNRKKLLLTGGGLLAGLILAAGVLFMLQTNDGTLVVEINEPDAVVEVLNGAGKVEISRPSEKGKISIAVDPGKHRLKVTKDDFEVFAQDFAIARGGEQTISAKLVPLAAKVKADAFDKWMMHVAASPAEQQVQAVASKLRELNPRFDGKETHAIENNVVTHLEFNAGDVVDLSPLRALPGLKILTCSGSGYGKSMCADLSPLKGMPLTILHCFNTQVSDLSPLKGMPLTILRCYSTQVSDLSPLKGMPLTLLICDGTQVSDLSPLKDMKLTELSCNNTKVADLSPLKGMPLTYLGCGGGGTKVSDLSPLKDMKLTNLNCGGTQVSDLSPLKDMKLTELSCYNTKVADLSPLKGMPLTKLDCAGTKVSDLSPLKDMSLTVFSCNNTQVGDLSPLKDMKLTELHCQGTQVADLSPLQGMPLKDLHGDFKSERNFQLLRSLKTLEKINDKSAAEFLKQ